MLSFTLGWYEDNVYDATVPLLKQVENPAYEAVPGVTTTTTSRSHHQRPTPSPPPPVLPKPPKPNTTPKVGYQLPFQKKKKKKMQSSTHTTEMVSLTLLMNRILLEYI